LDSWDITEWEKLAHPKFLFFETPYCGSGMFIPDPEFYPSRIPDPKTATKKLIFIPCFVATYFTKLKIILFLKC
jgi:hypothetical protein